MLSIGVLKAQPNWVNHINLVNDTIGSLNTVKVITSPYNEVYVLLSSSTNIIGSTADNKIYLNKYTANGNMIWSFIYDNGGIGSPKAFDMVLDNVGEIYLAGGNLDLVPIEPFLMKLDTAGTIIWNTSGGGGFITDWFDHIEYKFNNIYVGNYIGVEVYNTSGVLIYEVLQNNTAFSVDYSGRIAMIGYNGNNNIFRFTDTGGLDFEDSTIFAQKISIDYLNNIYIANGSGTYDLVKYSALGVQEWMVNNFPPTPPFGDVGFDILFDNNNDIIFYGVADYMHKYNAQGQLLWSKYIPELDSYIMDGTILSSGFIALTGSLSGFAGNDVATNLYNVNGDLVWSDIYNGSVTENEFAYGIAADNGSIYVLSSREQGADLINYINPGNTNQVNYSAICIDSIYYDSIGQINIKLFNGSFDFINYPTVTIVSPSGDTISQGNLNFFGQSPNTYQVYTSTITLPGIIDFSNHTFLLNIAFPDTSVQIYTCIVTSNIINLQAKSSLYPNPANDMLNVNLKNIKNANIKVYNMQGEIIIEQQQNTNNGINQINIQSLSSGLYFIHINGANYSQTLKFIKQ